MKLNEYQERAMSTARKDLDPEKQLLNAVLGLAGEAGEVAELIKKREYHGRSVEFWEIIEEAGDVLWYITLLAESLGTTLEYIADANLDKLRQRYPKGW